MVYYLYCCVCQHDKVEVLVFYSKMLIISDLTLLFILEVEKLLLVKYELAFLEFVRVQTFLLKFALALISF
jgi:hypothetical protein